MNQSLKSLRTYLEKGGDTPRWTPTPGVVIVGAGKGGVGTSTVAALLALAGSRDGRQVLLVDGDEGVGSLHLLLGLTDPGPGLGDLKGGELTAQDLLRPVAQDLWFLPGGGGGQDSTLAASLGERRALYQRVATLYSRFDLVIMDGGSHLASVSAACSAGAERLLALTTPDRVAMASTHALLKVTRERFPFLPVEILVNCQKDPSSEEVFQLMSTAAARFLDVELRSAGSLPMDPALQEMSRAGTSISMLHPSAPSLEAAGRIHGRLAAEQEADGDDPTSILTPQFAS